MSLDRFVELYLDYRNNFLNVWSFAAHYGLPILTAERIVEYGRAISNLDV
jgi:hypothetical protein